jgi:predicted CoA-binding protein
MRRHPLCHVSGLSYDVVEIFGHPVLPVHPKWSGSYWFGELAVPALSSVRPIDVHVQCTFNCT